MHEECMYLPHHPLLRPHLLIPAGEVRWQRSLVNHSRRCVLAVAPLDILPQHLLLRKVNGSGPTRLLMRLLRRLHLRRGGAGGGEGDWDDDNESSVRRREG